MVQKTQTKLMCQWKRIQTSTFSWVKSILKPMRPSSSTLLVMPSQPASSLLKTLLGKCFFRFDRWFVRNNYAKFKEIRTRTITVQGSRGDSKKAKLFITLERSSEFFDNMKKFNEIKEENERLAATAGEGEKKETKEWKIDKWNTMPSRMFWYCQELNSPEGKPSRWKLG